MPLDEFEVPEKITGENAHDHPARTTQHAVGEEGSPTHSSHAGDKWDEGAEEGDEPTNGNGHRAVLVKKFRARARLFWLKNRPSLLWWKTLCPKAIPITRLKLSPAMAATGKSVSTKVKSMTPVAQRAPMAKSIESPGRNGVNTRPVSQKMTAKRMA
jgi:hypothetical protein